MAPRPQTRPGAYVLILLGTSHHRDRCHRSSRGYGPLLGHQPRERSATLGHQECPRVQATRRCQPALRQLRMDHFGLREHRQRRRNSAPGPLPHRRWCGLGRRCRTRTDPKPVPLREVVDIARCQACHDGEIHKGTAIPRLSPPRRAKRNCTTRHPKWSLGSLGYRVLLSAAEGSVVLRGATWTFGRPRPKAIAVRFCGHLVPPFETR